MEGGVEFAECVDISLCGEGGTEQTGNTVRSGAGHKHQHIARVARRGPPRMWGGSSPFSPVERTEEERRQMGEERVASGAWEGTGKRYWAHRNDKAPLLSRRWAQVAAEDTNLVLACYFLVAHLVSWKLARRRRFLTVFFPSSLLTSQDRRQWAPHRGGRQKSRTFFFAPQENGESRHLAQLWRGKGGVIDTCRRRCLPEIVHLRPWRQAAAWMDGILSAVEGFWSSREETKQGCQVGNSQDDIL